MTNPQITAPVNGSTVNVGTIAANQNSVSKVITIKGSDLTKALNVSVSGTGFSVTPSTISAANANNGTSVTVTYTSSTAGNATGTLTISSSEVSTTVNLTANKIAMPTISISPINAMEAEQNEESTIVQGTVTADNNDESIVLSVMEGNFEISLNRINWAQSITLDASGETFYVRLANTNTAGDYYGSLSATTSLASAYADLQGTVNEKTVQYGDVNMDGTVSISDVTTLIDYLLGGQVNPFDADAADVNHDSTISIADVTELIDKLLNPTRTLLANNWYAVPVANGIAISNPLGEMIEIYNLDGDCLTSTNDGQSEIILPAGIYMVSSDTTSHKVVVKWDWHFQFSTDTITRSTRLTACFLFHYVKKTDLLTTYTVVLKPRLTQFVMIKNIATIENQTTFHLLQ